MECSYSSWSAHNSLLYVVILVIMECSYSLAIEENGGTVGCNPCYNGMLIQCPRRWLPRFSGCNPCYNGMLIQCVNGRMYVPVSCNPCYNGMLIQLSTKTQKSQSVVILVIMECSYSFDVL